MSDYTPNSHIVYLMQNLGNDLVKIGLTNDVYRRWYELRRAYSQYVFVRYALEVKNRQAAFELETALHRYFSSRRKMGEWFDVSLSDVLAHIYVTPELRNMVSEIVVYPDVVMKPPKPKRERKPISIALKAMLAFVGYLAYSTLWLCGAMSGGLSPEPWEVWTYLFVMVASIFGLLVSLYGYLWETVKDQVEAQAVSSDLSNEHRKRGQ